MIYYKNILNIIEKSYWPIMTSLSIFNLIMSMIFFIYFKKIVLMIIMFYFFIFFLMSWFCDINMENEEGKQSIFMKDGFKISMIIFIFTEIMFFFSWFWSFFHSSLSPVNEIGNIWPPIGIMKMNPFSIPLLNTFFLLSSGVSVTYAHHLFLKNKENNLSMIITLFLGFFFSLNQIFEYYESFFSISDSIYGSTFFVITGFHGLHVFIGIIFLSISWKMIYKKKSSEKTHNMIFTFSIWYWHFVDIVWLFLMLFVYIWS